MRMGRKSVKGPVSAGPFSSFEVACGHKNHTIMRKSHFNGKGISHAGPLKDD